MFFLETPKRLSFLAENLSVKAVKEKVVYEVGFSGCHFNPLKMSCQKVGMWKMFFKE